MKFTQLKKSELKPRSVCLQVHVLFVTLYFILLKTDVNSPIKQNVRKLHENKSVFSKFWVSGRLVHKHLLCGSIVSPASCPSRVHQKSLKCHFINMIALSTSGQRESVSLSSHTCHFDSVAPGTGLGSLVVADFRMLVAIITGHWRLQKSE